MIIAVVGLIGAGKDTIGDMLVTDLGFKRDAFARPLKDVCSVIFGWDRQKLEGTNKADRAWREIPDAYWSAKLGRTFTPRLALQLMGTEAGRNVFGEGIWTAALIKRVQDDPLNNYVVTDARFRNEIDALTEVGATIVRVKRGPEPSYYHDAVFYNFDKYYAPIPLPTPALPESLKTVHQSEYDWIGSPLIQIEIDNCGTIEDLKQKVMAIALKEAA